MLVLDMIEILPPLRKCKYNTWRILPVKCYIDNSMCLRIYIRNVNNNERVESSLALGGAPAWGELGWLSMALAGNMHERKR
jgi:hypothetical protein